MPVRRPKPLLHWVKTKGPSTVKRSRQNRWIPRAKLETLPDLQDGTIQYQMARPLRLESLLN